MTSRDPQGGSQDPQDPKDPGKAIVPYGEGPDEAPKHAGAHDPFWAAVIWCTLGAAALSGFPVVGVAMVAFGAACGMRASLPPARMAVCVAGTCVGGALGLWYTGFAPLYAVQLAVDAATAWAMGVLVFRHRANVTSDYLVAAAVTCIYLGVSAVGAHLAGTTLSAVAVSTVDQAVQAVSDTMGLDIAAQYRQVQPLVLLLWPFAFFIMAGCNVLAGHAGARLATLGPQNPPQWNVLTFEAPTWSVVALICGIALFAFAPALGDWAWVAQSCGATVVAAVRFVFMLQGFAVLGWWMNSHHVGCLLRFVVLFLAVDLEASFLLVSFLGLVDFWANLRHLARGGSRPKTQA